ncbi:hypothetical protein Tco_1205262 [Tanacetum coccineum]
MVTNTLSMCGEGLIYTPSQHQENYHIVHGPQDVLRPRGRPKRFGRLVVNGVSVRGSRRPLGRPFVNKVTNLTGLELARPSKSSKYGVVTGLCQAPILSKDVHELFHHSQLIQVYLNSKAGDGADMEDPELTLLVKGSRSRL